MAHMIETMAYLGETPWHGLGVRVSEDATRDPRRMLVEAGLDWEVERVPLMTVDRHQKVDRFATRRVSDGRILGTVGTDYRVLQNERAFEWFRPFIEAGEAAFHTAGSLRSGSRVWVLAKLQRDPLVIKGDDIVEKYLLLSHGHDGTLAIRAGFTPIRVVCQNTLTMAHGDKRSELVRIRHTQAAESNLENLRDTINAIDARFEATAEQFRLLAHKDINAADVVRYVHLVFGLDPKTLSTKSRNMVSRIVEMVETGRGMDLPGVRGTWWAAYNGVSEYLTHERGRSQDSRLNSLWYGDSAELNRKALDTALELAAA